jgi:hypothetical protein
MTENTTLPLNVLEHVEPRQPAVGGGSQAWEGKGSTTAKKKKKNVRGSVIIFDLYSHCAACGICKDFLLALPSLQSS